MEGSSLFSAKAADGGEFFYSSVRAAAEGEFFLSISEGRLWRGSFLIHE